MNRRRFLPDILILVVLLLPLLISCSGFSSKDPVREGFINPPDSCGPGVYWYIMDGNLDRKGITGDLESMKKAGIAYALFLEVNVGIPRGNTDFLSEKWQELFTHAVREAERLGIRIILGSGPGWAGSGGPWVSPRKSMMHLVSYDTLITGPAVINAILPRPGPKTPFFGESSLTPGLKEKRQAWYQDVRVLAFPAPEDKSRITDIDEKALFIRAPFTSQKGVVPFIQFPEIKKDDKSRHINRERIIDISANLDSAGKLNWIVPPGKWIIMRLGKTNNGAVTRPAPVPGLGFEADKFDTAAFREHFEAYTGKLINRVKPRDVSTWGGWKMIHIDSWEMGAQNWTDKFLEQFIKHRGYDPLLYLPVMEGYIVNTIEESERFLWDVRQTSNELIAENHAGYFKKLGRKNGMTLSIEPYDMNPSADFDLGSVADVPMGEFWCKGFGFNSSYSCIEATSIAHVTGKPVTAAEAFTAGDNEAWKMYPGNMKNQTDWALAMGINRFIFHTFAHKSFFGDLKPGMTMGPYGVHWDRGQTWWPMAGAYHEYLSRCQFILSQGSPVADILYLTPEGAPVVFRPPATALAGSDTLPDKKEWSFDCCSPKYLINNAYSLDSKVCFPGGAAYRILVLPDVDYMTPELLGKIDMLLKGGVTVIGGPVKKSPSLTNYPVCDETVVKYMQMIWNSGTVVPGTGFPTRKHGLGYIITPENKETGKEADHSELYPSYEVTSKILTFLKVKKDFSDEGNFRYNHRHLKDKEVYFISNRTSRIADDSCTFRDGCDRAELWDAVTGDFKKGVATRQTDEGFRIRIRLEPYQSIFVVFDTDKNKKKSLQQHVNCFPELKVIATVNTPWTVNFDPPWGGPSQVSFNTLSDWSKSDNEAIRYYSGIARYSCTFSLPAGSGPERGSRVYLDLGDVRNIASIRLNGKDLGVVWTVPYRVNVSKAIRQKDNRIEIEVANLWINRLIGDEAKPWDGITNGKWPEWLLKGEKRSSGRYTFTTHHFYRKDDPLVESGLLGPVNILEEVH